MKPAFQIHLEPVSITIWEKISWKFQNLMTYLFPYSLRSWWTKNIRIWYNPQHSELRKAIPKVWTDLDHCAEEFIFACIVSYVDLEDGLENWENQEDSHPAKQNVKMLKEAYHFAKFGRKIMEEEITNALMQRNYKKLDELESEKQNLETKYMVWFVETRKLFWT